MASTTFSGPVTSTNGFIVGSGSTITKALSASATIDFTSISAASQASVEVSVPGASVGDEVILALPAAPASGLVFNAFVSSANNVTIRASNITGSPVDPASATYGFIVIAAS